MWVFGYGSLVWRPSYDFVRVRHAWIEGWERRFWQGSTDHRGLPERPGRVVTLVESEAAVCWGSAYELERDAVTETLAHLDHREKGGYRRLELDIHLSEGGSVRGLCYLADDSNENFLGPASDDAIAAQVLGAFGPSGSNVEYVLRLAEALRDMGARDDHVFRVEAAVRAGMRRTSR